MKWSLFLLTLGSIPAAMAELQSLDDVWKLPVIYSDKDNSVLQEFRLTGQYHTQYAYTEAASSRSSDLSKLSDWETRRFRLGFKARLFERAELRARWGLEGFDDDDFDPRVSGVEILSLAWKWSDELNLIVGKHKARLTAEYATSADEIVVPERSILTTSVMGFERPWGISVNGEMDRLSYQLGWYESDSSADTSVWFNTQGGGFTMANLEYDLANPGSVWSQAKLGLHYAHATQISSAGSSPKFGDLMGLNLNGKVGAFGVQLEALAGLGAEGDLYGINLTPTLEITPKLQAVARYTYAKGDHNSLQLRKRYEGTITGGKADEAHAIYAGLNYLVHGHHLKFSAGAEYLTIEDRANDGGAYEGWTALVGMRLSF